MEPANAPQPDRPESGGPPAALSPQDDKGKNRIIGIGILLAVAVLLVFGRVAWHDFVNYDDEEYVSGNPYVQRGLTWAGAKWAFQTGFTSNWHPLTWLSLMMDTELFGRGPLGPHLMNLLLHAANTVLVFVLLRRLTGADWRSALVAALFGLHPLHVESVAWVSERKDVLSALFGLLTLLMYARYAQGRAGNPAPGGGSLGSRDYRLALLFFALGLMSKPMLVTLPFVMLLLDYWPLERVSGVRAQGSGNPLRLVWEKIPFILLSVASSIATLIAQKGAVQPLAHITVGIRAVNAIVSYGRYLYKTFWPANLAIPYMHPGYGSFSLFSTAVVLILTVTIVVILWRNKSPYLVTGWFWFLGMLVPVIGLVQVGMQSMADRYTYLPLIGIFIMVAWGAAELFRHWRLPVAVAGGVAVLMLVGCSLRTLDQLRYWKNSETLFRHTIAVTGNNEVAYYNLGHYYSSHERFDEAIDGYSNAVRIKPNYDDALHNLGIVLAKKGDLNAAIPPIREAIRLRPDKADAYYNLGGVYARLQNWSEAEREFREALKIKPNYPEAHNNLANVLVQEGRAAEAVPHYREALRLKPDHEGARRGLQALGQVP